jgi:hypothetical protein
MNLTREHIDAVNRRRRIIIQNDAADPPSMFGMDMSKWLDYRFNYIDEPGSQVDSIWWDIAWGNHAAYPSKILPPTQNPGLRMWLDSGIDWIKTVVDATHERGLEAFWHDRVSEVDIDHDGNVMAKTFSVKVAHPDWVVRTWWWQGLWNLASPGLREYKTAILRELAENYDFDGFQIDFSRHVPCLPEGRQWEMREHVTEYVRMVREMLLDVAAKRGRPILLSAKVPENLEGCRIDGLDVATWAEQKLVDMFTLGSRTMDVDISAFKTITEGRNIKLHPCFDDHHTTDGYRYTGIEFFRGVFGNWWQQGADGVVTFNWHCATPEVCEEVGGMPGPESQRQAYHEVGDFVMLAGRDKIFAVERRGGYPRAVGYFNKNLFSPLPAPLANDGSPRDFSLRVCDDLPAEEDRLRQVSLRVTIFGALEGDRISAEVNGIPLDAPSCDFYWKDPQIFSPKPQPPSGGDGNYTVDPGQKLLLAEFSVPASACRLGRNRITISAASRGRYPDEGDNSVLQIEKVEIHTKYLPGAQWRTDGLYKKDTCWHDARDLYVGGKGFSDTEIFFHRLPARAKKMVLPGVWAESIRSSGIFVGFTTDSVRVSARWKLLDDNLAATLAMTTLASSGVDLYARDSEGGWRWLGIGVGDNALPCVDIVIELPPEERDYLLYLPLYNIVESLEIGIDPSATITAHQPFPGKPIVYYGTSIVHGVGASRSGMTHPAILSRRLNVPMISFGFSGNGTMDLPVAELMAEIDSCLYIVDCLPNMVEPQVTERTEPFVARIRKSRSDTPILLMEDRTYANAWLKPDYAHRHAESRRALRAAYEGMVSEGVSNLHYLAGNQLLGDDDEATVDCSHPSDLGYWRYADAMEPVIRQLIIDN